MGPKAGKNEAADKQAQLSQEMFNTWKPMQESLAGQGNQLLQTGGISELIPLLAKMMEATRSGFSKAQQATTDSLGRGRMGATPFGQRILADQRMAGEQQVGMVAPNFYQQMLPMIINAMTGNTAVAQQGMSSTSMAESNRRSAEVQAQGQFMTKMIPSTSFGFGGKV